MPTFTSYPNPKVVGSVAQDDKGWSWIYNGSAWDSMGFVKQFNPFSGFIGPFAPAITDPTALSFVGVTNQDLRSVYGNGALSGTSTNPFTNSDPNTIGAWALCERYDSSGTKTGLSNLWLSHALVEDGAFNVDSTISGSTASGAALAGSAFSSTNNGIFKVYETGGAYDESGDTTASSFSADPISSIYQLNGRPSDSDLSALTLNLQRSIVTDNNATVGMENVDQFIFKYVENTSIALNFSPTTNTWSSDVIDQNSDPSTGTVEFRRGNMVMDGWWLAQSAASNGTTTQTTSGSTDSFRFRIYELYVKVTPDT